MLKERFLNRDKEVIEEEFIDDGESEDDLDGTGEYDDHDNEDREQDRIAKYFSKRARRNQILEEFVGDSQFSRSRLIDEDVTMQQDLKSIKVSSFDAVSILVVLRAWLIKCLSYISIVMGPTRLYLAGSEALKEGTLTFETTTARLKNTSR